jgi:transcriptional antiterminator NusG
VLGFLGDKEPIPLLDGEVQEVLGQIEDKKEKVKPKVMFDIGETVKVTEGPFVNFNGVIDEINPEKGKLRVMVSIFGRSTPLELEYWQVERT